MIIPSWIKVGQRVTVTDSGKQRCYKVGASGVIISVGTDEYDYGSGPAQWCMIDFDRGQYSGAPRKVAWAANHLILKPEGFYNRAVI